MTLAAGLLLGPGSAFAGDSGPAETPVGERLAFHMLPAPPRPQTGALPTGRIGKYDDSRFGVMRQRFIAKVTQALSGIDSLAGAATTTIYRAAPGAPAGRRTLVLYDNVGEWAWLGEAYAVMAGQLASSGGEYVLKPAAGYAAGDMGGYTAVVYLGSTYDAPLPTAFLDDVLMGGTPVLWMNYNIWQLAARAPDFAQRYGFSPLSIDFGNFTTVDYKGADLLRDPAAYASGLLQVQVQDPAKATVLATARRDDGSSWPWATRGGNLTYIGELPFSYVGPNDRYLAAADLIAYTANPLRADRKRALVRIEDVGPDADPAELRAIADYLSGRGVPFSIAVYPMYKDPNGAYNGGVPVSLRLARATGVASALRYMQSKGGTIIMHGYTHQYENLRNPYTGTSADDFEFYLSHIDDLDYVRYDGPVPVDTQKWATGRINSGLKEFSNAGFAAPTIFEFPHYAGSALDYKAVRQRFTTRYDRGLYAANWCANGTCGSGTPDYTRVYGQYFPFAVRDVFDSIVLPESLGNIELEWANHHPPRYPADILASARRNAVVQDRVQSFFFHPYVPIGYLQQVVEGIQGMGYQFVGAAQVQAN